MKKCHSDVKPRSCKSSRSTSSRPSVASSTSTRSKFIAAKAKAADLEVRASFLKEKQVLRIAAEELELKQQIAEVKMEEKIYGRYNEQEPNDSAGVIKGIDGKDCPNVILSKDPINTSSPMLPLNPNASCFTIPDFKDKEKSAHQAIGQMPITKASTVSKKQVEQQSFQCSPGSVEKIDMDKEFLEIQKRQTELTEMIATQQLKGSLPTQKPPTFSSDIM